MASAAGSSRPLVLVMGATGTGKSKLAVRLCQRFNGELVNTDSMQLYNALPIATNQETAEQVGGVVQHLIGFLPVTNTAFTVVEYRERALAALDDIWARGRLPVVVGGTNYYIEAILWRVLLSAPDDSAGATAASSGHLPAGLLQADNAELRDALAAVDPSWAALLHPNERRKLLAALQHYYARGERMSESVARQRAAASGGSSCGGPLRFERSCVVWLRADADALRRRLEARVDEMVARGLRDELCRFYDSHMRDYLQRWREADDALCGRFKGVFQCIGLKEFEGFLQLSTEERATAAGETAFEKGRELVKVATRQYARSQDKWVRNRLLRRRDRQVPPIYALDCTDAAGWTETVCSPAEAIVEAFLSDRPIPLAPCQALDGTVNLSELDGDRIIYQCQVCDRALMGAVQFSLHTRGKRHRFNVMTERKRSSEVVSTNIPRASV